MMAEDTKRFYNIWARMDSDAEGEAVNAFMKVREFLRRDSDKFIRFLDINETNAPRSAYDTVVSERDAAIASAKVLEQRNAALANEINVLRGKLAKTGIATDRSARAESYRSWGMGLVFGLVLALLPVYLGVNLSPARWLNPAWKELGQVTASGPNRHALQQIVEHTAWAEGDTASHAYQLDGADSTRMYWVKLRRWKTDQNYVNAANEPVTEYCTSVYAQEAASVPKHPGLYEPPQEYDLSGRWNIAFPHAFDECVTTPGSPQLLDGKIASR